MSILRQRTRRGSQSLMGQTVFPSPTAGQGKVEKDGYYMCKQCGFWNDKSVTPSPGGTEDGNGGVTVSLNGDGLYEPVVSSYCSFCGSANSR